MRSFITVFTVSLVMLSISLGVSATPNIIGIAAICIETNIIGKGEFNINDSLYEGDEIATGPKGSTTILFNDESMLTLGPNAHAKIENYSEGDIENPGISVIRVTKGQFRYFPGDILENGGAQFITVSDKFYGKSNLLPNNEPSTIDQSIKTTFVQPNIRNEQTKNKSNKPSTFSPTKTVDIRKTKPLQTNLVTTKLTETRKSPLQEPLTVATAAEGAITGGNTTTFNNTDTQRKNPTLPVPEQREFSQDALDKLAQEPATLTPPVSIQKETQQTKSNGDIELGFTGKVSKSILVAFTGNADIYNAKNKAPTSSPSAKQQYIVLNEPVVFTKIGLTNSTFTANNKSSTVLKNLKLGLGQLENLTSNSDLLGDIPQIDLADITQSTNVFQDTIVSVGPIAGPGETGPLLPGGGGGGIVGIGTPGPGEIPGVTPGGPTPGPGETPGIIPGGG